MDRATGYNSLMREVCVGLGFCGSVIDGEPCHVDMFIPESGPITADQFIDWVFKAEGMTNVGDMRRFNAALRTAFVQHMGGAVVDASMLKWDVS